MQKKQVATELLRQVFTEHAAKIAISDVIQDRTFTYSEIEDLSSRLASLLRQSVKENQRVAFVLSNSTEMIISYLACMQARVTSVPINPDFHLEEIQMILEMISPALVLTGKSAMEKLSSCKFFSTALTISLGIHGADYSLADIMEMPRWSDNSFPQNEDDDLTHIVLSSGSSGLPKAIPIRFGKLIEHVAMFVESHSLKEGCVFHSILPMAFLGGWYNLGLVPFFSGSTVILDRLFGGSHMYSYWDTIKKYRINCVWYTPSMLSTLLTIGLEEPSQRDAICKQIRWGMVGMAPLMPDLKKRFEDTFGFCLQQSYGLSETFLFTSWMSDTSLPDQSVGKCLKGYDVKLIGESGDAPSSSNEGEVLVKSQWMFEGYWQQDNLTKAAFTEDGYFKTGDIGCFDSAGNLYITGRIKDIIIRNGLNIAPAEIENILYRLDGVREVAAIGVPDPLYGEKIIVFMTCSKATINAREVLAYCHQHITTIKIPSSVYIIPFMPLNASGKIDKKALKEQFLNNRMPS